MRTETQTTYMIVRFYFGQHDPEIVDTGLSLEDAQAHCRDPETSSSTALGQEAANRTLHKGDWFEGYEEEG
jgi:hypothetical protein